MSENNLTTFVILFGTLFVGLLTVWATIIAGGKLKAPKWMPVSIGFSAVGLLGFGVLLFSKSIMPLGMTSTTVPPSVVTASPEVTMVTPTEPDASPSSTSPAAATFAVSPTSGTGVLLPGIPISSTLALDAKEEYTFTATANVPILITITTPESDLHFRLVIVDSLLDQLESRGSGAGELIWPFTPPKDGEYKLQVIGTGNYGSYNIRIEHIDNEVQRNRQILPIETESVLSDNLALGAHDEYKLTGSANVPVLITIDTPDSDLHFQLAIIDALGKQLELRGSGAGKLIWPFTPPEDAEYTLRVVGTGNFGSYNIRVEYVDNESQRDREIAEIQTNSVLSDKLALNASDEYVWIGTANQPVLITVDTPESDLHFRLVILNTLGEQLVSRGSGAGELSWTFTPPANGAYTLKVIGAGNFGSYNIRIEAIN